MQVRYSDTVTSDNSRLDLAALAVAFATACVPAKISPAASKAVVVVPSPADAKPMTLMVQHSG
jgi:hypothetical protein